MKKKLLFFILCAFLSIGAFAQFTELIQNGSFELPADGVKYDLGVSHIPNWNTDQLTPNTNREAGHPATASLSNISKGLYQVVDKISSTSFGYKLGFVWKISWDGSTSDTITMTAKLSAFSGSNRSGRVKVDSLNFLISHTSDNGTPWQRFGGAFRIPASSTYAGDSLVLELYVTKWTHNPTENNLWSLMDSVSLMKSPQFNDLNIVNGSFELPATGSKIDLSTGNIPGWATDETNGNRVNREGLNPPGTVVHTVSMMNLSKGLYNVIDKVSATAALYNVNYSWHIDWDGSTSDTVTMTAKLSAFSGSNRASRVKVDSINFSLSHLTGNSTPWKRFQGTFSFPDASTYQNDSLVLSFQVTKWTHNPSENNLWILMDSVVVFKAGGAIVHPTGITLSTATHDSLEVNRSLAINPAFTPAGTTLKSLTWSISDTTIATISNAGVLTAKLNKGTITVTATSVSDPTVNGTKVITIFKHDATSIKLYADSTIEPRSIVTVIDTVFPKNVSVNTVKWTVSDTIAASIDSKGSLTIKDIMGYSEALTVTATSILTPGISGSKTIKIVKKNALVAYTLDNFDFEQPYPLPGGKVKTFYGIAPRDTIPGWFSDDKTTDNQGVEPGNDLDPTGHNHAYQNSTKVSSIYRPVDAISNKATTYVLTFLDRRYEQNTDTSKTRIFVGTFDALIKFSHYKPGQAMSTRLKIDSAKFDLVKLYQPTQFKATLNIPANASYAGDSLIIEIGHRNYLFPDSINYSGDVHWANFDDVTFAVSAPVVHPTSLSLTFEKAGNTLQAGKSGLVSATIAPANATYNNTVTNDVTWTVSDATIATIDATGILKGLKKGTVVVTGTAMYDPTVHNTISIVITSGVGVENLLANKVAVYPNPSNGNFTVAAPAASQVSIIDATGKIVYSTITLTDKTNISINGSGLYLVQITTGDKVVTKKINIIK